MKANIFLVFAIGTPFLVVLRLPPRPATLTAAAALVSWGLWLFLTALNLYGDHRKNSVVYSINWLHTEPRQRFRLALLFLILSFLLHPSEVSYWSEVLQVVFAIVLALFITLLALFLTSSNGFDANWLASIPSIAIVGMLAAVVGLIQIFLPSMQIEMILPPSAFPGRATGTTGHPNHFASLLVWSLASLAAWLELGREQSNRLQRLSTRRVLLTAAFAAVTFAVVLSASRGGALATLLLAAWGGFDRSLSRWTRLLLLSAPLQYALGFALMLSWSDWADRVFIGEQRLVATGQNDGRLRIWSDAVSLVLMHPWTGVGWGNFNFAWALTPFPERSSEPFGNVHNLPLHLAAVIGLPVALVIIGSVVTGYGFAVRRIWRLHGEFGLLGRWAAVMLAVIGLHSLFEYPLWYPYFLFPTAFLVGVLAGAAGISAATERAQRPPSEGSANTGSVTVERGSCRMKRLFAVVAFGGLASIAAGLFVNHDNFKVYLVYSTVFPEISEEERIERGKSSFLFYPFANRAAAFRAAESGGHDMKALQIAARNLLDPGLMILWARAYAQEGDLERARYIAARAREFKHPEVTKFFQACEGGELVRQGTGFSGASPATEPSRPFQCDPPTRALTWRDFLPQGR